MKNSAITWMINHKVAANLLMLLLLAGGLVTSLVIRKEYMPETTLDRIGISISYPGAAPDEIESSIALPIEAMVDSLEGIREIKTSIRTGKLFIRAELQSGVNPQKMYQDVQQVMSRISSFPAGMEKPRIFLASRISDVMEIVVHANLDKIGIKRLTEQVRDQILQSPHISQVAIRGTAAEEVHIEISQQQLKGYGLTLDKVAQQIKKLTKEQSAGSLKSGSGDILINIDERRLWAHEYAKLPIISDVNGDLLLLEDIATIKEGFADTRANITFDGQLSASLRIFRVGEQTPDNIAKAIEQMWPELISLLPPGAGLTIVDDDAKNYSKRLGLLLNNAFVGLVLVLFCMSLFLDYRLAFWVVAGIPSAFLGAILFLPLFDVSINMVSMFGFIIALGIVVDDAIIAGENIYAHMQEGMPFSRAALLGAQEVAKPLTYAILTNIVAFIPLLFLPGFMKLMFGAIPVVVILCFLVSWIEALFILPSHLAHISQKNTSKLTYKLNAMQQRFDLVLNRFITNIYRPTLLACLKRPALTLSVAIFIGSLTLAYAFSGKMGFSLMPKMEGRWVKASLELSDDIPADQVDNIRVKIENNAREMIKAHRLEESIVSIRSESFDATLEVSLLLVPSEERQISSDEVKKLWREHSKKLTNLGKIRFGSARRLSNELIDASVTMEIRHNDRQLLNASALAAEPKLLALPGVVAVSNTMMQGNPQWQVHLTAQGRSLGLTPAEVSRQLRGALYGARALRQHRGKNEVTVLVRLPLTERSSEADLENLLIQTSSQGQVPLHEVATIEKHYSPARVSRYNGERIEKILIEVEPEQRIPEVVDYINNQLKNELSSQFSGLKVTMSGQQAQIAESVSQLELGTLFALAMIYILLAVAFESYSQPLLIMAIIPFGAVGAILGHLILGYSLSVVSLMGMLALAGVVVNDSLILVEYANNQRAKQADPYQAILQAGERRFRPILLTTLTTFGGLAPMVFETSRQAQFIVPMAVSLGFGILFTTFVCLLVLPCLYILLTNISIQGSSNLTVKATTPGCSATSALKL
jgi:multidrug efflux pump subunit AcrB